VHTWSMRSKPWGSRTNTLLGQAEPRVKRAAQFAGALATGATGYAFHEIAPPALQLSRADSSWLEAQVAEAFAPYRWIAFVGVIRQSSPLLEDAEVIVLHNDTLLMQGSAADVFGLTEVGKAPPALHGII
jgi:hypothetical protein